MRDILFKAKAINRDKGYHRTSYKNGDWVYGLITRLFDERFENLPAEMTDLNGVARIEIDHKTICQYTGLTDKNGNKIWENDIVEYRDCTDEKYVVAYESSKAMFEHQQYGCSIMNFDELSGMEVEVIGNIFDNAELLEGQV